jgi:SAM-dependent methyltransferase
MATMGTGFVCGGADEDDLELRNGVFWTAMIDQIRRDGFEQPPRRILDVGCHRGGLLARIAQCWGPNELLGVEPNGAARARARLRLNTLAASVAVLDPSEWHLVPDGGVDLVVCHEVLFLLPDLDALAGQLARVLSGRGRAYIVAGCHSENPVWASWRAQLEEMGQRTFDHAPIDVLAAGGRHGLLPSVRPLRESGWATHDPTAGGFSFSSVTALLDHQFRHKLLFRLARE